MPIAGSWQAESTPNSAWDIVRNSTMTTILTKPPSRSPLAAVALALSLLCVAPSPTAVAAQDAGASLRVVGRRSVGNETVVNTEIVRTNGRGVPLDWYLTESDGQYRITDVVVAGLSMKIALRDQFASWIQSNGGRFSALLAVL